jgi:hypothetical protein
MLTAISLSSIHAQEQTVGLQIYNPAASEPGYSLVAPFGSTNAFMIDIYGRVVNVWETPHHPGAVTYFTVDGHLLRTAQILDGPGGTGGRIEEYDWEGNLVWAFDCDTNQYIQHHDIAHMPNGNILMITWEFKTYEEAVQAGRDSTKLEDNALWPLQILELEPTGSYGANIVWEWHVWDHLIQDHDSTRDNYGVVAEHPELVDINFPTTAARADWIHANSINYNPQLDQIIISSRTLSEMFVIDHSTTTAEAAGHTGGNSGMGGDLLYRWGNPQAYRAGTEEDQQLWQQHDANWVEPGMPGEGNILVFSNGSHRPEGRYSTVEEVDSPVDMNGNYPQPDSGEPHGPAEPAWMYIADPPTDFFGFNISGAHRLANGNTIICEGPGGRFFETTPQLEIVWQYTNPLGRDGLIPPGEEPSRNATFRCYRYAPDYPGFDGIDLTAGAPMEQYCLTIASTSHTPSSPAWADSVFVTSVVAPDSGRSVAQVEVYVDTGLGYAPITMFDDGEHHDGAAGDSLFGAAIPPVSPATYVSYYIRAVDDIDSSTIDPPIAPTTTYLYTVKAPHYVCGDVDDNELVNVADIVYLINFVFGPGDPPIPEASGDVDCNDTINVSDVVYLIDFVFGEGAVPCADC